ncbi:MAG: ribosome maturation factor RimM [Bacteroidales bacterium]|jgi:16S rRNA processing protein RimM|nr:ribosome maturation factor RimM [Bacteroidales bacterium]
MIQENELQLTGKFLKPHGSHGEMLLRLDNLNVDVTTLPYIVCCIDGIFVPFFIEQVRPIASNRWLVKIQDATIASRAKMLTGASIYLTRNLLPEITEEQHELTWKDLIGFSIIDLNVGVLGEIEAIDETTVNTLFLVVCDKEERIFPANEDFIHEIKIDEKIITVTFPEGLFHLR